VLCLIVVPLPPGKTPFGDKLNNNNNNNNIIAEGFVPKDSQSRETKEFFIRLVGPRNQNDCAGEDQQQFI
jgi:hypothetical protein